MDWITTSTILEELGDPSNQTAWDRLVSRFRTPIVRFARKMGLSEADAQDAAQETLIVFVTTYRDGRYDRSKGRLSRWLFGIAYRQALRARRSAGQRAKLAGSADPSGFWADVPDEESCTGHWDHEWEQALLAQCLDRIRQEVEPATMQAFELVMRGDRTPAEAAAELGVPVKVVYNAKYTVLKRVRETRSALEDIAQVDPSPQVPLGAGPSRIERNRPWLRQ